MRHEAYERHDYRCWACNVPQDQAAYYKRLEAHEAYQIDYLKGSMKLDYVTALCHSCHSFIHKGRLSVLMQSGKISRQKYTNVMHHGLKVLHEAGYDLPGQQDEFAHVSWQEWHLVIEGEKYFSKFKDKDAWRAYYE